MKKRVIVVISLLLIALAAVGVWLYVYSPVASGLVMYILLNKNGDYGCDGVRVIESVDGRKLSQRRVYISLYGVDDIAEAEDAYQVINRYYSEHPSDTLLDECYVEIDMSAVRSNYSCNFICSNSESMIPPSDKDQDYTVEITGEISNLVLKPVTTPLSLSDVNSRFTDIRSIHIDSHVKLDDISSLSSMTDLEVIHLSGFDPELDNELITQIRNMYPGVSLLLHDIPVRE